jgi:glycosyltransferase involved in cell wall biosynthesis
LVPSGLLGALCQKYFGCKNYVTIHAAGLYLLQKIPFGRQIARFICNNSEKIFVVSNFGKKQLLQLLYPNDNVFLSKIKIIPMGVYTQSLRKDNILSALEKNFLHILFIGRIVKKKGLEYAISALNSLRELDVKLHICGDGPMKKELVMLAKQFNLKDDRIVFYGKISESKKISLLNSCNLLLVPSIETEKGDKEGLPVVILEALAANLPVIASNVGGISEIIKHKQNGWLIEPKNSQAISIAIKYFYENRQELAKLKNLMDNHFRDNRKICC